MAGVIGAAAGRRTSTWAHLRLAGGWPPRYRSDCQRLRLSRVGPIPAYDRSAAVTSFRVLPLRPAPRSSGRPAATYRSGLADEPSDDAAWQEIVANYGERVPGPVDEPASPSSRPSRSAHQTEPTEHHRAGPTTAAYEERLRARLRPRRSPACRRTGWQPGWACSSRRCCSCSPPCSASLCRPSSRGCLVGGFLGGFGYLVAQMPRGPRDPFDDGARL